MIDHLGEECYVRLTRIDRCKTCEIADVDFPVIEFGPSRAAGARSSVEIAQMGITAELADHMQMQGAKALDELLFAEIAIDHQGLEGLELLRCDEACNMGHIGINPCVLCVTALRGGGLFDAPGIGAVMGNIDPSQGGNLQALFRTAVGTVPEHVKAIGLLATFGEKAGIEG